MHQNLEKTYQWNTGDYYDHYLEKDFLVSADVFKKFVGTCLNFYKLDRCHYFSSPGLSSHAMLKITGIKLEKGLREGISYIVKRQSKANNKYTKNYDPTNLSTYIW